MYNGTPLVERIKRLVEKQISILEGWSEGNEGGLSEDQVNQLRTIAMVARQLDLDNVEASTAAASVADPNAALDDLLAKIPVRK